MHGGPFANIAHGCNSVLATTTALKLTDYVVTEAGFGADLGGEKFLDIKCRKTGLAPDCVVLVATIRALKMHGGVKKEDLKSENLTALEAGMSNLARHVENVKKFGLQPVVSINRFSADTAAEIELVKKACAALGVEAVMADHWAMGGEGAADVAKAVVRTIDSGKSKLKLLYPDEMPLLEKIRTIAREIYRAKDVLDRPLGARPARLVRGDGLRQTAGLHRQDAVQLLHQPGPQGRAGGPHHSGARGPSRRRRRVRGGGVRRHHDDARLAKSAVGGLDRRGRGREDRRVVLIGA